MQVTVNVFFGAEAPKRNKPIQALLQYAEDEDPIKVYGFVNNENKFRCVDDDFSSFILDKEQFETVVKKWFYIPEVF